MWIVRRARLPSLVPDQPVEGLRLEGEEVGDFELLSDPAERDTAGCVSARRTAGLRRAGSCQDASFRGPGLLMRLRLRYATVCVHSNEPPGSHPDGCPGRAQDRRQRKLAV